MFKKLALVIALPLLVSGGVAVSGDDPMSVLRAKFPGLEADDVRPAPVDGMFEIALGPQVVYVSGDGRYLLRGDLIDLQTNVNVTDQRRNGARAALLDDVAAGDMIVFAPDEVKHKITVFTDIDCGYCRKLHREMNELHELGVQVQYLFFPRTGPGSNSWAKADNVWCADDRNDALTRAKAGDEIAVKQCDTPVDSHYQMGQMVGLRGTPAIVTETGELIAGYLPAKQLVSRLETSKNVSAALSQ